MSVNSLGPNLIFFFTFFVTFSLVELFLIALIKKGAAAHAQWFIDTFMRFELHHKRVFRWGSILSVLAIILVLVYATSLAEILKRATPAFQGFAGGLVVVIFLIYFLMTRQATSMAVERRIQTYLYTVLSICFFAGVIVTADRLYGQYTEWVNTHFINPAVREVRQTLDEQKKETLLKEFRAMVKESKCERVDYTPDTSATADSVKHFVFVALDTDLIAPDYVDGTDLTTDFTGQACTNGQETFLLKKDGSWYWVISDAK